MKKSGLILVLILLCAGRIGAQGMKVLELQGGYLDPKGTAAGAIFGGNYGISIDERVDLSIGLSYFHKGYSKETKVASSTTGTGSQIVTETKPLEYSTTLLPITANATVHIPFQPPWGFYLGGSLAYEFLFDKYTNHEKKVSEKSTFSGFGWIARAGMEWSIGSRSSIALEAFYNNCQAKRNQKNVEGLPVWDEVDVSGLGFRAGIRVVMY